MKGDMFRRILSSYVTTALLTLALLLVLIATASSVSAKAKGCQQQGPSGDDAPVIMLAMVGNRDLEKVSNDALAGVEGALRSTITSIPGMGLLVPSSLKLKLGHPPVVEDRNPGVTLVLPVEGSGRAQLLTVSFTFTLRVAVGVDDRSGSVVVDFRDSAISDVRVGAGALGGSAGVNFDLAPINQVVRRIPSIACIGLAPLAVGDSPLDLRFSRLAAHRGQLLAELRSDASGAAIAAPPLPVPPAAWKDASSIWIQSGSVPTAATAVINATYPDGMNDDGDGDGPYRVSVTRLETDTEVATAAILAERSGWLSGCAAFETQLKPVRGADGGVIASDPNIKTCSFPSWLAWLLMPDGDALGRAMTKAIETQAKATIRLPGDLAWTVRVANWTATPDWLGAQVEVRAGSETTHTQPR